MLGGVAIQRLREHPSAGRLACAVRPVEDVDGPDLPLENGIGQRLHNQALPDDVLERPRRVLLREAPVPATLRLLPGPRLRHEVGVELAALVGEYPELPGEAPGNATDAIPTARALAEQGE